MKINPVIWRTTALRSGAWVGSLLASVLLVAAYAGWQAACWLALAWGAASMVWQLLHVHWLILMMQTKVQLSARSSEFSNPPSSLGVWGEVFYIFHRLSKKQATSIAHIRAQQASFTQAIQASPNAFVMLDDAGRVAWMNGSAQALLGLDAERDTGQNLAFLLRTPAVAALLDSTRQSAPVKVFTQGKTISVQALPYGERQTLLLGQDLTAIEHTERVRRDFVANVSHELRTPLTVLAGYAELLHDHAQQLPPAMQEAVGHMRHHTQRMSLLTQDLLQLATLDAGDLVLEPSQLERLSVRTWLDSVRESTAVLALGAGAARLVFEPINPAWAVRGLHTELHSALSNLITNALRYTPAGGTVTVVCSVSDSAHTGQLQVAVSDTGCGIAAEHLPRLTERFYRVSASRRREGAELANSVVNSTTNDTNNTDNAGTGLGLAIVKHIMLRHSGELRIASTVGVGSVFTLVLPLAS